MESSAMTPMLREMLYEMRQVLTREDIKAGLPVNVAEANDASTLYVEWCDLKRRYEKQKALIDDLDHNILLMSPWGDFPMSRIDQLAQCGQSLRFWRTTEIAFYQNQKHWIDNYQIELVNVQDGFCYFVSVTPIDSDITLSEAEEVKVLPSPVSTLISLQTRAKDSLRKVSVIIGDFALQHYYEIEEASGLHDTLVLPGKRQRFMSKIKKIIKTIK